MKSIHYDGLLEADYLMGKWGLVHQLMQGGQGRPPGSRAEPYKPGFTLIHYGPDPWHLFEGGSARGMTSALWTWPGLCYKDNFYGKVDGDPVNSLLTQRQKIYHIPSILVCF